MTTARSTSTRIFISYRRQDAPGHVLALFGLLCERFGEDRIFKDTDGISIGQDFVEALNLELASCSVVLVIIGREWLTMEDERHQGRRLDDPLDFVHTEVKTALEKQGTLVVPVLVERAAMPAAEDLPPPLRPLARRHAIELRDDKWKTDVDSLIAELERVVDPQVALRPKRPPGDDASPIWARRSGLLAGLTLATVLGGIGLVRVMKPSEGVTIRDDRESDKGNVAGTDGELDPKLVASRREAADQYGKGRRTEALDAIATGLRLDPTDLELRELLDRVIREAQSAVREAERDARKARAPQLAAGEFNRATSAQAEAASRMTESDEPGAIRRLWSAAEGFKAAASSARERAAVDAARNAANVQRSEERDSSVRVLEALEGFRVAYTRKDVDAVRAIYPTIRPDITRSFQNCSSVDLRFESPQVELLTAARAQVTIRSTYSCQQAAGGRRQDAPQVKDVFQLERRAGSWVITDQLAAVQ